MPALEHPILNLYQQENWARLKFSYSKPTAFSVFLFGESLCYSVNLNATRNKMSLNPSIVIFFIPPGKTDYSVSTQLYNVNNPKVLLAVSKRVNSLAFSLFKYKNVIA